MDSEGFEYICKSDLFPDLAQRYIDQCRDRSGSAKPRDRFPNLAGFCRYCGIDSAELERMAREFSDSYDMLRLIFEDEALNFGMSPTTLSAYLKRRLGYGEAPSAPSGDGDRLYDRYCDAISSVTSPGILRPITDIYT